MSRLPQEGEEVHEALPNSAESPQPARRSLDRMQEERTLAGLQGGPVRWLAAEGLWSVTVGAEQWSSTCQFISDTLGHPLSTLFGDDVCSQGSGIRVHALFLGRAPSAGVHVICPLDSREPRVASLVSRIPFVSPFEREVAEMFGVKFEGATDLRPLLLHERHPSPPLLKGAPSAPLGQRHSYPFRAVHGEGIYEIPVGPVHAGVIEPGHFRFQVIGERILDLETRFGYTHKGTERLFEGQPMARGTIWAESVSGDMSVAGGLAYAHAVERALGVEVPPEVEDARGLLAEIERIAFLCGDVSGISLDVGYAVGAARANTLREMAYTTLGSLTGSRLGRATVAVGGLRRPLNLKGTVELQDKLQELSRAMQALLEHLLDKSSVVDRLQGTGTIPRWTAEQLHFLGPTARASGLRFDLRTDRPYGAYRGRDVNVPRGLEGDVQDRLRVKVEEIIEACRLSSVFLPQAARAEITPGPAPAPPGGRREGLGWVESPRGEFLVHAVVGGDGRLERVHVRDPSFLTWPAIEFAVRGNIVPDFPLCNKSLNLSYSGYDR